jgi:hypothetical protein
MYINYCILFKNINNLIKTLEKIDFKKLRKKEIKKKKLKEKYFGKTILNGRTF